MVEEKKLQEATNEVSEDISEKTKEKGYYLADIPTNYTRVIAFEDKQIAEEELVVKMANALKKAGILKE
ncbi:MAG: hypothetical protein GWP19_07110 [Planctomycetia bacterium]|nr:hypothetical protein [Planctomycetia bacterium]